MRKARQVEAQAGFTIVEILVVLAITAVVFGLSAISISLLKNRTSPETLATKIVHLLNGARVEAETKMRPVTATIDMKDKIVSSDFDDPIQIPQSFEMTVVVGRETVSNTNRLQVRFLPDGTSSGVEIRISDTKGRKAKVETNWLTGLTRQVDVGK